MPMLSEIATELLQEHATLRRFAQRVRDALAGADERDQRTVLVIRLGALVQALDLHNQHEEQLLADVIPTLDAWGAVRRERMDEHHLASHARLSEALRAAADAAEYDVAARAASAALEALAGHMAEEEQEYLNASLLRDDGPVIDQSGG